jgi:putative oxidoreductase
MAINDICSTWSPRLLSLLRIVSGLLFLQHGTAKFLGIPFIQQMSSLPAFSPSWIAGVVELIGGALLVLGLFTRPVAFLCSGLMAAAYFYAHAPRGFYPILNAGELAVLYCFVFLYISAAGAGPWSLDALRGRR